MKNFDEYIAERRKKSPKFTLFGTEYALPPSIPYKAVLYLQSVQKRGNDAPINDEDILYFFEILLGKEHVKAWQEHEDFDIDLIVTILSWVIGEYGLNAKPDEPEKKLAVAA
jgi:hypothetical protein